MPLLVLFGAGNIGRGFIAPTFTAGGWRVRFVDVDRARIAALRDRGAYRVIEEDGGGRREVRVEGVDGIDAGDAAAVEQAVAEADLAATAVGLAALPAVGRALAAGLARRLLRELRPLDVLVCENGAHAHESLRAAVLEALPPALRSAGDQALGTVRTSIGRMIPASTRPDPLDIEVESYAHLPVERAAFKGPIPELAHLEARADFDLVLGQKLYLHNLTHACLAYGGHHRGLATIADCAADPELAAASRAAGDEAAEALAREHAGDAGGVDAIRAENRALLDGLFIRYRNPMLDDPVARVARDPFRKLDRDDRLVGAARLCLRHGIAPSAILAAIAQALTYRPAADEPGATEWLRLATPLARLAAATALPPEDPVMTAAAPATRRTQAAAAMRAAGIVITPDEERVLEIADFGLGRFEQLGLAIHVYVNTARCCAKELVMLPGQICPEHRHPPIAEASDPGKEETFRVRAGEIHLFLPGPASDAERDAALGMLPADKRSTVTVFRRVHLKPGQQCTLPPNTPHWFAAGAQGAVVSEFSTRSRDEADVFTDHEIRRVPVPA